MAQQNLCIQWDGDNRVGYPILDEQHRGLIATINSLYYFIQQGWELESLKATILILEQYVKFHLKTEEMILMKRGLSEDELKAIHEYGESFLIDLHKNIELSISEDEPQNVVKFLVRWWKGHKVDFHDELKKYFEY